MFWNFKKWFWKFKQIGNHFDIPFLWKFNIKVKNPPLPSPFLGDPPPFSSIPPFQEKTFYPHPYCQIWGSQYPPFVKGEVRTMSIYLKIHSLQSPASLAPIAFYIEHIGCTPPPLAHPHPLSAGWVEPPAKFSKKGAGLDKTSTFRGGCWERVR